MGAAYFYHLTHRPLEVALPQLLDRALAAGWRVAVRGTDPGRIGWLDEKLWLGPEEGFLPHGCAGGAHDAHQPILLTTARDAANIPQCVMTIDGAPIDAAEVKSLQRVCILFDGTNGDAVQAARVQWKALTSAGCAAQYWAEDGGRWECRAERPASDDT
ncbi:DNA polymerase III subunit chi [Mesobacterium sp. TK19101]|uniref:DNA polymerase III subunit chi n=1 Tax=Mesobacterium hydrothermale TaxID=3111907 RepID=A0ABU6HDV7_9RHOB|nr:DNA polymerase III subunit chi [Mesobacterium sp. TK19101]MEC3860640.1 DNA polymerase III subunit chi [Mesobacterium sp. TK19101]